MVLSYCNMIGKWLSTLRPYARGGATAPVRSATQGLRLVRGWRASRTIARAVLQAATPSGRVATISAAIRLGGAVREILFPRFALNLFVTFL
jgi:hypothetical protein